jgi:demethylmenaquinone methyltransferase / 2-methoxy-6-polyprenyl-1,4-benzoquinol methylase
MSTFEDIHDIFRRVSSQYDPMNDLMSLGFHRLWKKHFVDMLPLKTSNHNFSILDMACGTWDLAYAIFKRIQTENLCHPRAFFLADPNETMMEQGLKKAENMKDFCEYLSLEYLLDGRPNAYCPDFWDQEKKTGMPWIYPMITRAEDVGLADGSIDLYTISFGLRNVSVRKKALQEALRLLKPGGYFYCMEFSHPISPALYYAYQPYLKYGIPALGKWVAKEEEAYSYLSDSIQKFPSQKNLAHEMQEEGFLQVSWENIFKGIVSIHRGRKPF